MIKNLISKLTKPKGLFFDGYQWLVERNNPTGNVVLDFDFESQYYLTQSYPHRYEEYKQNRLGWWINTEHVVHCTEQLNKEVKNDEF